MRRIVIIVVLLAIGGLALAAVTRPEPTPATLYAQAVEALGSESPYRGEIAIRLAVEPGEGVLSPAERLALESLRDIKLGLNLQKTAGKPETASLQWQGQTIPVETGAMAAAWWEQFAPHEVVTKNRDEYQIVGTLSVTSLLPDASQGDPLTILLRDLTSRLEQIPATLILKPQRQWLRMVYRVQALEFEWSQTLDGDRLTNFPLGIQTKSAALDLRGRLEITPRAITE